MTPILSISIPGDPVGKGRPKFSSKGRDGKPLDFVRTYTPAPTVAWESGAATIAVNAWAGRPIIDGPVEVKVRAVKSRTKALLHKRESDGRMWRTTKPDVDNVVKAVLDALVMAGVIRDDTQVVKVSAFSLYAARDAGPCVEVFLAPVSSAYGSKSALD